ncbi:MAG: hypothetical protein OEW42_01890 [Acidimicrobiia bacterium]|nr:hypothetical protein [Acidimicrobiia bacterium]MDH5235984.1 hypothetical protein [Acidimicrobiia bacterium]
MRRASLRLAALCATLILLLAACGSDDPEAATDDAGSADTTGTTTDQGAADAMDDGGEDHAHGDEPIDVSDLDPAPSLELDVRVDEVGGFNVHAVPADFELAPQAASTDPVAGQGHLHLWVDGEKVSRFYNQWLHVGDLEPGDHEFRVELSANNHSPLAIGDTIIDRSVTVTQPEREGHGHSSDPVDVSGSAPAPSVEITVTDDPESGFNLRAVPGNHTLTPENVNGKNIEGEGHMHIYVDGEKLTRLYGEWYHLPDTFGAGDHEVRVELSANDHSPLAIDGEIIEATATFTSTTEMIADGDDTHDGDVTDGDHGADDDPTMAESDHRVEITYADGAVVGGPATIEAATGDVVTLVVSADVDDEIHVHGADATAVVAAGETVEVTFTAAIPGQFEIELEDLGQLLATLVTS